MTAERFTPNPPVSLRADARDEPWPMRPWIMAALCAAAGLLFHYFVEMVEDSSASRWPVVGASFVAVAAVSFTLTVERRRWWWSAAFALIWGLVIGLVGWTSYNYNGQGELVEFPFLASIFAVLLACPLFQTARDEGAMRFTSGNVHNHAWTDAVIGAASLAFVGIAFLLAWLIASLFELIGIRFVEQLLEEPAFAWSLAGFAFGGAVGVLRERDVLVGTMQRLVMVVLSVLAPVLAGALLLFLVSLPLTGLSGLWDGWASAAALTLAAAAGSYLLLNAAIGLGDDDRPTNRVLRWAALVLALVVLPLAALAMAALVLRIGQYGWTPERIWAVICAGVALAYGAAGWWAVWRGRMEFAPVIRSLQTRLALAVCGIALLLALPIADFGAVSARDQLARLQSGAVKPMDFDWTAMAFDFGPAGRASLERLARSPDPAKWVSAKAALLAKNRYDIPYDLAIDADQRPLAERMRIFPAGRPLSPQAIGFIDDAGMCRRGTCVVQWIADKRIAIVGLRGREGEGQMPQIHYAKEIVGGEWAGSTAEDFPIIAPSDNPTAVAPVDLATTPVEIREVRRRQVFVGGEPKGELFE